MLENLLDETVRTAMQWAVQGAGKAFLGGVKRINGAIRKRREPNESGEAPDFWGWFEHYLFGYRNGYLVAIYRYDYRSHGYHPVIIGRPRIKFVEGATDGPMVIHPPHAHEAAQFIAMNPEFQLASFFWNQSKWQSSNIRINIID